MSLIANKLSGGLVAWWGGFLRFPLPGDVAGGDLARLRVIRERAVALDDVVVDLRLEVLIDA